MTYNLANELDKRRFSARAQALSDRGSFVELTERSTRSRSQNAYLHLLIGVVAIETGTALDYAKEIYFKRTANPSLFVREKEDKLVGKISTTRSSAELTKEEMTTAIGRFKRWAAENGIYLPNPGDEALLRDIEAQISRMQNYL